MGRTHAGEQAPQLIAGLVLLNAAFLLTCNALAVPRLKEINVQVPAGNIVISNYSTPIPNGDSDNLDTVRSVIYLTTGNKRIPIATCYTHNKSGSLENIIKSRNFIAVRSFCEELAISHDGGATWNYWNREHDIYTDGFIDRVSILSSKIDISFYRAGPPIHFDRWTSLDGGKNWKKLSGK